jgi:hypothetical protein
MNDSYDNRWTLQTALLVAWLIVPASAWAGEERSADAVKVFDCSFDEKWDENYDRWPDRWVRKESDNYPHYVNIEVHDDAEVDSGKCLTIDLDGAAAAISSPPIRVMSRFGYVFEAELKNDGLKYSKVLLTLDFLDKAGRVMHTRTTKPIGNTRGWEHQRIDEIEPDDPAIIRVVIGLKVVRGAKGDLHGRVSLANVSLSRLPRIGVSSNNPCNVYSNLDDIVIRCELSGIQEPDPEIRFQLFDETGSERDAGQVKLNGQLIIEDPQSADDVVDGIGGTPAGYEGSVEWRPRIPDFGYYRVVVRMVRPAAAGESDVDRELDSRTISLAFVSPLPASKDGEFGWTLPHGDHPLSFHVLSLLLPQAGINWVELPVWFDASNPRRGDELIRFVELVGASNIDVVGVIDRPPAESELAIRPGRDTPIADLLSLDPSAWSPTLEPVMSRLSLRVRWWQLGGDSDTSFCGYPGLSNHIDELRTQLFRFGQDVHLGISWDWTGAKQVAGRVKWDFEQLRCETPPSENDFAKLLAQPRVNTAERWVSIEPPPPVADNTLSAAEALAARCAELVRRLVAAKVAGVDRIIVADPFDDVNGLVSASGMPAALLLPWRTTATLLGGAEYLGKIQLPSGSENRVFLRPDGQVVMVVWSDKPVHEVLFLGNDIRCVDIWGRTTTPQLIDKEQIIDVRPQPTFVIGLHEAVTRLSMALSFDQLQVPSVFSKKHPNAIQFTNFFPQGVGGSLRIVVPREANEVEPRAMNESTNMSPKQVGFLADRWVIEPPKGQFQLAPAQEFRFPFDIVLKNALYGKQPVRVEFNVEADEPLKFTVFRQMEVGTADLTLDVKTHLDNDGNLIVEQFLTNHSKHLTDFRCSLFARGYRWQRSQVYRLGDDVDRKVYRFPHGKDLIGQELLLEIEERNGPRVLKYRFVATDSFGDEKLEDKSKIENHDRKEFDHWDSIHADDREESARQNAT